MSLTSPIRTHDAVTYGGIRVGEVKDIAVSEDRFGRVRITVGVDPSTPVRKDSTLILKVSNQALTEIFFLKGNAEWRQCHLTQRINRWLP